LNDFRRNVISCIDTGKVQNSIQVLV
jgi:hypothetical protein